MKSEHSKMRAVLPSGQVVLFAVVERSPDPYLFIRFRSPDGRRLEKSSKKTRRNDAVEAAADIIRAVYEDTGPTTFTTWDDAVMLAKPAWSAQNLREETKRDYQKALANLRHVYPSSLGPADITTNLARNFKAKRMVLALSPNTVNADLRKLSSLWRKWFIDQLGIVGTNPWEEVEQVKVDVKAKRILSPVEERAFLDWLHQRFGGWPLPVLFFRTKAAIGCRISELASLHSVQLMDGRIVFPAHMTKGRKDRGCLLPPDLYADLRKLAGPVYLWESYSDGLREHYRRKGGRAARYVRNFREFSPPRLVGWIQDQVEEYRTAHPDVPRFTAHNFRGTAMSRAKGLGVSYEEAAIAFDCHVETMKAYYVDFDETKVADAVFARLNAIPATKIKID